MDDESIRVLFFCTFVLVAAVLFAGGWVSRVSGSWSDGVKRITLQQFGPFVWGTSCFDSGRQQFFGRIVFGYLKLSRRDFGDTHLRSLGFTQQHLQTMQGTTTGFFKMRLRADAALVGHFFGRTFTARGGKMVPTSTFEPVAKTWQRSDEAGNTHT